MIIDKTNVLEYRIVSPANVGKRNKHDAMRLPPEQQNFLHFRIGAKTAGRHGHFKTPGYDDAWEQEKAHIEAERLRLLYVAATRAREHLILPAVTGVLNAKGLLGQLVHNLPLDYQRLVRRVAQDELTLPVVDNSSSAQVADA